MWNYQLIKSTNKTHHYIFLDNNVFRILKRDIVFWDNFFNFFEKNAPEIMEDFEFLFTWPQILEDLDIKILSKIRENSAWTASLRKFNDASIETINESLDRCFITAKEIIVQSPELEKEFLINKINISINYGHASSRLLIDQTLVKAKNYIESNNYMESLSYEIAWAIITSHDFINKTSPTQYEKRKIYFDAMLALWHKLFLKGYNLDSYRLIDKRYHAYLNDLCSWLKPKENVPLKPGGDWCDSQLIHYASLSYNNKDNHNIITICITTDPRQIIEHRIAISKMTFLRLNQKVEGWNINPTPGEVICLETKDKGIIHATRIPFNAPFKFNFYRILVFICKVIKHLKKLFS